MNILGIDYGMRKAGFAISSGKLSEPLQVFHFKVTVELFEKIKKLVVLHNINKIVVGVSEARTGQATEEFVEKLKTFVEVPIEKADETLSTHDAQTLSKEANIGQKRRREMEDAFAAAVILQNYLDRLR